MVLSNLLSAKLSESWEEAASLTVKELFKFISENEELFADITRDVTLCNKVLGNDFVENMRTIVDYMITVKVWDHDKTNDFEVASAIVNYWCILSVLSFLSLKQIDKDLDLNEYRDWTLLTVTRKQRDYGSDNIAKFGLNGLVIRIHDKVARLENLIKKGSGPSNESLQDTLLDIIGYSIIAIKWINGTFLFPMSNNDDFMPKALTDGNFFYSIDESPINRHNKVPITTSNGPIVTNYVVYDSRGENISSGSYKYRGPSYPEPDHPNPKFR
jgi:hypothetical protein